MSGTTQIVEAIVYRLGWMLVHSTWQAALVAGLLAFVLRAGGRRISSSLRYTAAYVAMLLIVGWAAATFVAAEPPAASARPHLAIGAVKLSDISLVDSASPAAQVSTINPLAAPSLAERAMPWLVGAWVVGVIVLSAWQFLGWMTLQRWRRSAQAVGTDVQMRVDQIAWKMAVRRVVLKLSMHVDVPIVIGVWRPVVLAPLSVLTDLSPGQLEAILAHELAHVRRLDYVANLIHVAIETLLFYHPAIWWISRQIRLERECCCDELAAGACADRAEYVQALAAMEQSRGPRLAPAISGRGGRGELLTRVRRLLGAPEAPTRSRLVDVRSWATLVLLLSALLAIASSGRMLRAQQQPAAPPPPQPIPFRGEVPAPSSTVQPADLIAGPAKDYLITRNDLLEVKINDVGGPAVQSTKVSRVSETGFISLPWIGQIKAEGLTEALLEQAIVAAYRDKQLAQNAQVSVVIVEARGKTFTVIGAVAKPGQYQLIDSRMTLFDAIALAGGATRGASIRVTRHNDDGTDRVIEIPAASITAGDPKINLIIRPRDAIIAIGFDYAAAREADVARWLAAVPAEAAPGSSFKGVGIQLEQLPDGSIRVVKPIDGSPAAKAAVMPGDIIQKVNGEPVGGMKLADVIKKIGGEPGTPVVLTVKRINGDEAELAMANATIAMPRAAAPAQNTLADQEASLILERLVKAKVDVTDAEMKYGTQHSSVLQARQQVDALQKLLDEAKARQQQAAGAANPLAAANEQQGGEYYVGGFVDRTGVYSLVAPRNMLGFAITAAGPPPAGKPYYVQILRRNGNQQQVISDIPLQELLEGKVADIPLKADDQITVMDHRASEAPTTKPSPPRADANGAINEMMAQINAWSAVNQRMQQGEALTPTFVQLILDTSERLCAAQAKVANDFNDRVAVIQAHLDRCNQLADLVRNRQGLDAARTQLSQINSALETSKAVLSRMKLQERRVDAQ